MKSQRLIGILWLTIFSFIVVLWWWQFIQGSHPYQDWLWRVCISPILCFGIGAGFYLIRGTRWARFAVGGVALFLSVLVACEIWQMRSWPKFDGYIGIAALISAIILLSPKRQAVEP